MTAQDATEHAVPKYHLRFSRSADIGRVKDFYTNNHHSAIATRTAEVMEELTENGAIVLIEDDKDRIVAASVSYPIEVVENGNRKTKWVELGATRIATGGYTGFFNAMISAQILRTFLVDPPEDRMVAEMKDPPVQALARGMGWRPWANPPAEMVRQSYAILQDRAEEGHINWFQQGREGLPHVARLFLHAADNPVLVHRKTGDKIELSYDKCRLSTLFRQEVEKLAKRDLGDIEKPDMTQSLSQSRQKWLRELI